ncbi:MAG: GDP-fucose synthetase [Pelagibacteraceae bacterium TMED237]|nr:MAG: GDP-fucose synthetase [Pelagibacteraceae bacterium TMED237]|tara:strand:+ start:46 stop:981 length:936 start_codon:yes stop_codon:yes gene_type:complete
MISKNSKIFVTGHKGLVGNAVYRKLKKLGFKRIITISSKRLDLRNQKKVYSYFKKNKPDYVINAAAKVGGIFANSQYPVDFIFENLQIQNNIIFACLKFQIKDLIFLGSSCIYPKFSKQPIKEEYLLSGKLEQTNEPYAIAKIAGIKLCESINQQYKKNYKCLMPSNTYGPNDKYDDLNSHFLPALIKKIYLAKKNKKKKIIIWGSGKPKRELIYVDDIADACIYFLGKKIKNTLINIGTGKDYKIKEYAKMIMKIQNQNFLIKYDRSKPDGTPRKLLDISIAKKYGWKPKFTLEKALRITIKDFEKEWKY